MCGRFALGLDLDDLEEDFELDEIRLDAWQPTYSLAPSTLIPIVREESSPDKPVRILDVAEWGFHPSWAKESGPRPINARLETVATNKMFRGSFAKHRVLVPMTGYYEWTVADDGGKQPHYIFGDGVLAAAGITTVDEQSMSVAIITGKARDASGEVHDRMPVFIGDDARDLWLDPDDADTELLHDVAAASAENVAATLRTRMVDRAVNNVRTLNRFDEGLIAELA